MDANQGFQVLRQRDSDKVSTPPPGYDPSKYTFMVFLMCTSEDEVAKAMEKLTMPIVGLCLDGINIMLTRPDPVDEDKP